MVFYLQLLLGFICNSIMIEHLMSAHVSHQRVLTIHKVGIIVGYKLWSILRPKHSLFLHLLM